MKTFGIILTTTLALFFCETLFAQPGGRFPQMRERVSNARLNEVGKRMKLGKERVEQLRPLYMQFERERQAVMDERLLSEMQMSPDSLTEEQAERLFFLQMEKAKKMIALREKNFKEFRAVLSPKEIMKFHRIEKEVDRKMMLHIRQRFKNRFPGKK